MDRRLHSLSYFSLVCLHPLLALQSHDFGLDTGLAIIAHLRAF